MFIISDVVLDGIVKFYYCFYILGCRFVVRDVNVVYLYDMGCIFVGVEFIIFENVFIWIVSCVLIFFNYYYFEN